jgi:hypothetical protein
VQEYQDTKRGYKNIRTPRKGARISGHQERVQEYQDTKRGCKNIRTPREGAGI